MGKPKKESLRHSEAFEFYYSLGQNRSQEQVANRYGVTPNAIAQWAVAFRWTDRLESRDQEIAERLAERNKTDVVKMQERHLKVTRAVQGAFIKRLHADEAVIGAKDFLAAAHFEAKMMGCDSSGSGNGAENFAALIKTIDGFVSMAITILKKECPRTCPSCRTNLDIPERIGKALLEASARFTANVGPSPKMVDAPRASSKNESPDDAGPKE
jgi:hypothetical protein